MEESSRKPRQGPARVPLIVGVTGHRDLLASEEESIRERIRIFLQALQSDYPDLPLMVMTPLAEGADRLAAEVAHELAIPTVVLMPLPERLYQSDFDGASLAEFQQMRELGECIELPLMAGQDEARVREQGPERDQQYAQLGAYLAAHSHVLLAVWDGRPSSAPGGTAHVVRFHQHDVIELIAGGQHRSPIDFTEDESDLVYHVVCSRQSGPPAEGLSPGETYWFTRDEVCPRTAEMPERYRRVLERMSEFAVDMALCEGEPLDEVSEPLLPDAVPTAESPGAADIEALFQRADYLAQRFQRGYFRQNRWIAALALLAGVSFVGFADLRGFEVMIYPYILCIGLALALVWLGRRYDWQRKYLDYRVLAEGLRVQFYWDVAGVTMENPSRFSHDSFLKRQDLELGWIRNVMRAGGFRADAAEHRSSDAMVEQVTAHWVVPQHEYYARKAEERRHHSRVTGLILQTSFVLLLGGALLFAVRQVEAGTYLGDLTIALMGLLPFVVAARVNYSFRLAEREMLVQYQENVRIFSNAIGLLGRAPALEVRLEILRALGEAALDEHGLWIMRQRERPLAGAHELQG